MPNLLRRTALNLSPTYDAFPFQEEALGVIKNLEYAAIFHEQGLGKTKIAIDLALYWLKKDIVDSVLFVTKKGLVENWITEISIHTSLRVRKLTTDRAENHQSFHRASALYVAHYEAIKAEQERIKLFATFRKVAIVLDEAHKIKNPDSAISQSFHRLTEVFSPRIIMTGSPIANRPFDIWSQVWFLDQGKSLGTDYRQFKRQLDIPRDEHNINGLENSAARYSSLSRDVSEFEEALGGLFPRISEFSVRQTKNGAGIDLPKKHFKNVFTGWEVEQRNLYEKVRDEMRLVVLKDGRLETDISEELLKRLLRLVQITSNPKLVEERYVQEPGKLLVLRKLLEEIIERQEKAIIWTSFVENVSWLALIFDAYNPTTLHGRMSIEQRNKSVKRFLNDETVRVLIATPQSSKEGLTLTVANHVIFYDRSFSLDDYIQAQDRIHRISQDKECYIYNLIIQDSIEEWVDALITTKQAAANYGQGDINKDEYQAIIDYDLRERLEKVLHGSSA